MKKQFKSALVAMAVSLAAFSAHAVANNGDLIIGFTTQSGNDLEYDLGSAASLVDGETWNLSALLGTLNVAGVKWGVLGAENVAGVRSAYQTKATGVPATLLNSGAWSALATPIGGIFTLFPTASEGVNIAVPTANGNSWATHTIIGGSGKYINAGTTPNTTGYGSVNFYKTVANGSAPELFGTFSFANDGFVTFNAAVAVPEPSTYGLIAGAGLLLVSLRRKFAVQA